MFIFLISSVKRTREQVVKSQGPEPGVDLANLTPTYVGISKLIPMCFKNLPLLILKGVIVLRKLSRRT